MAGAAHLPGLERPEEFAGLLLEFLDQLEATGGVPSA
jgi:hypothetical protein